MNDLTPEERAALERLRRIEAGETYQSVYRCEPTLRGHEQRDIAKVIPAMLRLFPADDALEITEEWLLSLGFRYDVDKSLELDCLQAWITGDGDPEWQWMLSIVKTPTTRGEARRLFSALGIQLGGAK